MRNKESDSKQSERPRTANYYLADIRLDGN